jgi:hypothetical protein
VDEAEREQLRIRVNEARRGELQRDGELRQELKARSPAEIRHQTAERKAIFSAQLAHDARPGQLAVIAWRGRDVYLVSVGGGCARVLDLGGLEPTISAAEDVYALVAADADWLPFAGDPDAIVAVAAALLDTLE